MGHALHARPARQRLNRAKGIEHFRIYCFISIKGYTMNRAYCSGGSIMHTFN